MHSTRNRLTATSFASFATLAMTLAFIGGCAKHDASTPGGAGDTAALAGAPASLAPADSTAPAASTMPTDITPVRGTLAKVSDTALTVTTATGDVSVAVQAPLHVYQRVSSDLGHVAANSFVGVTSEKQSDGSQRATEIHIFPEDLRGTGEGSYLMTAPGAHDSSKSTMTNGTVQAKPTAGTAPRMTNGAVASKNGESLVVNYHGGSQTISIPSGVSVTALAPATSKLASGEKVVVLAKKQADGTMKASSVVLAPPSPK